VVRAPIRPPRNQLNDSQRVAPSCEPAPFGEKTIECISMQVVRYEPNQTPPAPSGSPPRVSSQIWVSQGIRDPWALQQIQGLNRIPFQSFPPRIVGTQLHRLHMSQSDALLLHEAVKDLIDKLAIEEIPRSR
jgi:hypothetical protein